MIDTYFMQIESVKTRPNMGMWCRLTDVLLIIAERDKLLTDFAAVQAENEKLRMAADEYTDLLAKVLLEWEKGSRPSKELMGKLILAYKYLKESMTLKQKLEGRL